MKNKRAVLVKTIISVILAIIVLAVLIIFMFMLFDIGRDKNKETAKSYLNSFSDVMKEVDKSGSGEFSLWAPAHNFRMVYFGDGTEVEDKRRKNKDNPDVFRRASSGENLMCFCYEPEEKQWICEDCVSLKRPIKIDDNNFLLGDRGVPVFGKNTKFEIEKKENEEESGEHYLFTVSIIGGATTEEKEAEKKTAEEALDDYNKRVEENPGAYSDVGDPTQNLGT